MVKLRVGVLDSDQKLIGKLLVTDEVDVENGRDKYMKEDQGVGSVCKRWCESVL